MSEDRRQDDARLDDIKFSVVRIDQSLAHLGERFDAQDRRVTENERAVLQVQAEHNALKLVLAADTQRLGEKVDGVSAKLDRHMTQEEADRRQINGRLSAILLTVLGTVGWYVVQRVFGAS